MAKKKKTKKRTAKGKVKKTKKTSPKSKRKKRKKGKKAYQRGDLGRAIFAYFDRLIKKHGKVKDLDKAKFERAEEIALKAKPDTTYGRAYFSWHKNAYRNEHDL